MKILNFRDFLYEKKLSQGAKKELLKWMSRPGVEISDDARKEIEADPTLRPVSKITLYRGLLFNSSNTPELKSPEYDYSSREKYSSWTRSINTAIRFSKYNKQSTGYDFVDFFFAKHRERKIDGELGLLISREFEPSEILLDTSLVKNKMTERTYKDESEVIVKPFEGKCKIEKIYTKKGEYSYEEYILRDMKNNYQEAKEFLLKSLENLPLDELENFKGIKKFGAKELIEKFNEKNAQKLFSEFYALNQKKIEIDTPEQGSPEEDLKLYKSLKEIYRYLQDFGQKKLPEPRKSLWYYERELVRTIFNKEPDRMKPENVQKLISKNSEDLGKDAANIYGKAISFCGNYLNRMTNIVDLIENLKSGREKTYFEDSEGNKIKI
jgi:hypothetical protein